METNPKTLQNLLLSEASRLNLPTENLSANGEAINLPELEESEINEIIATCLTSLNNAILTARKRRFSQNLTAEYARKINNRFAVPTSAKDFLDEITARGNQLAKDQFWNKPFSINEASRAVYEKLSLYFTADARMVDYDLDANKGLLVYGNVGCGKTILMNLFQRNPLQSFVIYSCNQIVNQFDKSKVGEDVLSFYSELLHNDYRTQYYGQQYFGVCFDDLGTESEGNNFSKRLNVMEQIFQLRYSSTACRGAKTHATTNLSLDQLEEKYGNRVVDRMYEMFNLIEFPIEAKSRRR